jgi:hypothetical protein
MTFINVFPHLNHIGVDSALSLRWTQLALILNRSVRALELYPLSRPVSDLPAVQIILNTSFPDTPVPLRFATSSGRIVIFLEFGSPVRNTAHIKPLVENLA